MNACGSCTLCCTVIRVSELDKPAGTRCAHAGRGCAIYEARPHGCQVFQCLWLASQGRPEALPAYLRPDRTGVVLEVNTKQNVIANCETPAAWKREPMRSRLIGWAKRTRVLIKHGEDAFSLRPDGELEPLEKFAVDPVTNENLYRRVA